MSSSIPLCPILRGLSVEYATFTDMSVTFLSVGTIVVFTDKDEEVRITGRITKNGERAYEIQKVTIVQVITEKSPLSYMTEISTMYDLSEIDENSADAGYDVIYDIKPELIREI